MVATNLPRSWPRTWPRHFYTVRQPSNCRSTTQWGARIENQASSCRYTPPLATAGNPGKTNPYRMDPYCPNASWRTHQSPSSPEAWRLHQDVGTGGYRLETPCFRELTPINSQSVQHWLFLFFFNSLFYTSSLSLLSFLGATRPGGVCWLRLRYGIMSVSPFVPLCSPLRLPHHKEIFSHNKKSLPVHIFFLIRKQLIILFMNKYISIISLIKVNTITLEFFVRGFVWRASHSPQTIESLDIPIGFSGGRILWSEGSEVRSAETSWCLSKRVLAPHCLYLRQHCLDSIVKSSSVFIVILKSEPEPWKPCLSPRLIFSARHPTSSIHLQRIRYVSAL